MYVKWFIAFVDNPRPWKDVHIVTRYESACAHILILKPENDTFLCSSEASPTFGHVNANLNHYHYSFL